MIFSSFCGGSKFWNLSQIIDGSYPEFSECFNQTALTFVPCGFLWLSSLVLLAYLKGHTKFIVLSWSWRTLARLICAVAMSAFAVLHIFVGSEASTDPGFSSAPSFYVSQAVWAGTFMYIAVLMVLCTRSGVPSPCIVFIFWLFAIIVHIVPVYTMPLQQVLETKPRSFSLACSELSVLVVGFVLMCLGEGYAVLVNDSPTGTPCPSVSASFLSRLTYSYAFRFVLNGYKKTVTASDAFDLPPHMQCCNIYPKFLTSWVRELAASRAANRAQSSSRSITYTNDKYTDISRDVQKVHSKDTNEKTPLLGETKSQDLEFIQVAISEKKPSLYKVLFKIFYLPLFKSQMVGLIADMLQFANPVLLGLMIDYVANKAAYPLWQGYVLAGAFFMVTLLISLCTNFRFFTAWNIGTQIKTVLTASIFKKAMTMNAQGRRRFTVGTMVNLMAVDCPRFQDFSQQCYVVYSFPLQISLALYMVYTTLGLAFLACLGIMLLLVPIMAKNTSLTKAAQAKQITIKDTRIKLMNEILNGVKVLKLYAWEDSFEKKITDVRKQEIEQLKRAAIYQSVSILIWNLSPVLITLTAFISYVVISGDSLTPSKAFVAMSTLNIIKQPMMQLPNFFATAVQTQVSMVRLRDFLSGEDLEEPDVTAASDDYPMVMESGTFSWDRDLPPTLNNVNMKVAAGSLVAVVGSVGCGKSSLLAAYLGEMERCGGRAGIKGTVAFVPQQAWIQNMTLRDNILFESAMEEKTYRESIEACALGPDIELLPGGEMTEIGEKGINLSGGQKQRISLARAVYQRSDVYLLDDPLSAVDAHVGRHIFDHVIGPNGVIKDKTRLLVSHGLHWLPQCDSIVTMDAGRITETGTFDQLMTHDGPFAKFIRTYLLEHQDEEIDDPEELKLREEILTRVESVTSDDDGSKSELQRSLSLISAKSESLIKSGKQSRDTSAISDTSGRPVWGGKPGYGGGRRLIKEERQEKGKVRASVFFAILQAFGYLPAAVIPVFISVYIGFNFGTGIWLSEWTDDPYLADLNNTGTQAYTDDTYYYLGIYCLFSMLQIVGSMVYIMTLVINFVNATKRMHDKMLKTILHQSMAFFDTTPMGRILNRFSSDVDQLDTQFSRLLRMTLQTSGLIISVVVVISYTAPIFLALMVPLMGAYYAAQKFYIPSSRQFRRIDSVTRSPIFSHFAESISGSSSIRAYRATDRFCFKSQNLVDNNNFWFYITGSASRWLRIRLEVMGNLIVLFAALFAVITQDISSSLVGLSITYALQVTNALNMFVQNLTQLETKSVSAERILEYSNLAYEPDWVVPHHRPPSNWPSKGEISFVNYSTRYREGLDLVLKDITFTVKPGEKVGVVGRTGAGKSSLSMAMFRVLEAARGQVLIDGLDISTIGLHDLRDKLTILPQDPVLFSSTLRFNLDPFNTHTDEEVWTALRHAHLSEFVRHLPAGLEHVCEEGGQNLSVGQRQLVCLARALLRSCRVLVLDEATAAVDLETDALLQTAIRGALEGRTLITVAHRLKTIIDYDRILVLQEGKIKEFDTPKNLLNDKDGDFYSMAKESGLV